MSASGFTRAATAPGIAARSAVGGGYLLSPAHDVPAQNVGALIGTFDEPQPQPGAWAALMDESEQIGIVLRTRANVRPLFVSVALASAPGGE